MLRKIKELVIPKDKVRAKYDYVDKDLQASLTPQDVLGLLMKGNERFVNGVSLNRDYTSQVENTASGQFPHSIILSCIDSRIPTEIVFDQGIGDLFNARIAGNFINEDILGSMEFACAVAGAKLILVMGHTSCGAVKGACDKVKLGNLTKMLEHLTEAVDNTQTAEGEDRSSNNNDFVDRVAEYNVILTAEKITQDSEVIKKLVEDGKVIIAGAMYNVSTGKVRFL